MNIFLRKCYWHRRWGRFWSL